MNRFFLFPKFLYTLTAVITVGTLITSAVTADVITSGYVNPSDPTTWDSTTSAIIGYGTMGSLSVTGGSSVSSYYGLVGYGENATGTVAVDGNGSLWANSILKLGDYGSIGTMIISNQGTVSTSQWAQVNYGSQVTVDAAGSEWQYNAPVLGLDMDGTLTITDGGAVTITTEDLSIGFDSDEDWSGTATVDGAGSTLSIGDSLILNGSLSVSNGGAVDSYDGSVALSDGSNVTVTVKGEGSTLSITDGLTIGFEGNGTLSISDGGYVTSYNGYLSLGIGGSGQVTVDGEDSAWDLDHFLNVASGETGTLTITNGASVTCYSGYIGALSDSVGQVLVDGLQDHTSQEGDLSFVLSTWTIEDELVVGNSYGSGTLSITNGAAVASTTGYLGWLSGSMGTVSVDGLKNYTTQDGDLLFEKSTWTNAGDLFVGFYEGTGELSITDGAVVTNASAYIGFGDSDCNGTGSVTVNGLTDYTSDNGDVTTVQSTWTNSGDLYLGDIDTGDGTGSVEITNGGLVTATSVSINSNSDITIDIGTDSCLKSGTEDDDGDTYDDWVGDIINEGTINLAVIALAEAGTYTPMYYGEMDGNGIVQAMGGIWNPYTHHVVVYQYITAQGAGGATASITLSENQRVLITNSSTGETTGAAFQGTTVSTLNIQSADDIQTADAEEVSTGVSFTATTLTGTNLDLLSDLVADTGESILSAWDFLVQGYEGRVYLSLSAQSAQNISDLTIRHLEEGEWKTLEVTDLSFDGSYAGFGVDTLGSYAVTAVVDNSCVADIDEDGDVDGLDLFYLISTQSEITPQTLASFFGKN